MPSITYKINQLTKQITATEKRGHKPTADTVKQYKNHAIKFGKWCAEQYGCRSIAECRTHIQDYSDWLISTPMKNGKYYSASTIHSKIVGACRVFNVPLKSITGRPFRRTSENTRSRGEKKVDRRKDAQPEISPRLYHFCECIGPRRDEAVSLRHNDLVLDESNYLCIRIRKGKGGKYQLQRILPEYQEFILTLLEKGSNDNSPVFSRAEMSNKLDLHHLRHLLAQKCYAYYMDRIKNEPEYSKILHDELLARWNHMNEMQQEKLEAKDRKFKPRRWDEKEVEGVYKLRGANRTFALKHGLPTEYNKLAVMAVSVFHLSHWRCNVTVVNYLMAI